MNREAVPLIVAICIPIIIVALIVMYLSDFSNIPIIRDIISFLKNVDIIYYIIIVPFVLGLLVVLFYIIRPHE